jgi:CheY-like chemotaxis protein
MMAKNISQAGEPASAPLHPESKPRQRILVVEDDAPIRWVNIEVLTYSGYHVEAAEDGAAAWDALQMKRYDLLVTDNDMPKLTGVELIRKLQAARVALPVILATGAVPEEEFTRQPLLKPAKTLPKPYTFEELLTAVKEVLYASNRGREEIVPPPNWRIQSLANLFQP